MPRCAACAAGVVADEITGSLITWDNTNELFNVTGGAATPANPTGRVRAVFAPREEDGGVRAEGHRRRCR